MHLARTQRGGGDHGAEVAGALAIAGAGGGLSATQARLNSQLGSELGQPVLAALISNTIGLTIGLIATATRPSVRTGLGRLRTSGLRWWEYIGGLGGASFVAGAAICVPHLGVALFTVGAVTGQITGGLICDRTGLTPGGQRPVTLGRISGAGIAVAAVALAELQSDNGDVSLPYLIGAAAVGVVSATQRALNGRLRQATVEPIATTVVNAIVGTAGLVVAVGVIAISGRLQIDVWPDRWWVYLGGTMGMIITFTAVFTVRALGLLRLTLVSVACQLAVAVVIDLITPSGGREVTAGVVIGVVLTFVGVAVAGYGSRSDRRPTKPDAALAADGQT